MNLKIKKVQDDFGQTMDKMMSRANNFQGAAARIYPLYQKFQTDRFQSEGSSEGFPWDPISEPYKTYKKRRFGGGDKRGGGSWRTFPGNGTKSMIATSTLAGAVIGPGSPFVSEGISKHRVLFGPKSMQISVEESGTNAEGKPFDYATHADEKRPLMKFSKNHIDQMKMEIKKYLFG